MKPIDLKSSTCIAFRIERNDNDLKFEFGDHLRIAKLKAFLQKITHQIGLKKSL